MYREHQSQPLRIDVTLCGMAADVRRGAFVSMHTSRQKDAGRPYKLQVVAAPRATAA